MKIFKGFSQNQIKGLLKKDLIVRLRQPWMTIMQIIWPCVIFISLYTLRHRFQPTNIPDCQFPTRQLPTKNNLLPFFHSYICTIENACQDTKNYEEYTTFENAPIKPLLNIAQTFINEKGLYDTIRNLAINGNWISAVTTLALHPKFSEIQKNIQKIAGSIPEVEKMIGGSFDIKKMWSDDETFSKSGNIICGKPFPRNDNIRFINDILYTEDHSNENQDELDAMPTQYCKQLYLDVTSSNHGKMTWTQVKPIIQGKIIYGPENNETLSIMTFANYTFEEMAKLQTLTASLDTTITKLNNNITFSDNFMKLIEFSKSPLVRTLVGNSVDVGEIEATLLRFKNDKTIADVIKTVKNILECFSADRFISVHNEKELREKSFELNKKRLFYGGIYFNQSYGNEIIYKLRVDTDNTPVTIETKNRFWFPGPESSMVLHMRYHRGFLQMKHSIDTGIIKHKKLIKFNEDKEKEKEKEKDIQVTSIENDDWSDWIDDSSNNNNNNNKTNSSEIVSKNNGNSIDIGNIFSSISSKPGKEHSLDNFEFDEDFDNEPKKRKRRQLDNLFSLFLNNMKSNSGKEVEYLVDDLKIFTKQFPYPAYTRDDFKTGLYLAQSVQMAFFMSLLIQIATCVRYRIWMKESKNTLLMRTMGLQASSEIISWIITTFVEILIVFIISCIILYSGEILHSTGFIFILIFLIIFGICIISFCYMCSTIFSSASIGSVSTTIFFLMTFLPYIVIICLDTKLSGIVRFITNLSFSTAFCYAFDHIMRQELQGIGISYTDAFANGLDSEFSYAICMIILDTIIYAIIGYIVERIKNDEYKFHKVERDNLESNIGATFQNVSKVYDIKIAISNISLDFAKDKITCLLGRNGAGKSTILKMLTGQITPSSGKILLSQALTSHNDLDKIGLCSQDNILIPHLTAKEHLEMYCKIKIKNNFKSEVERTMKSLNLGKYENYEAYKLSGGYQRRLCVAIAFIGSPSVVILDEPCSSIDTKARKYIWELVEKLRKGRAVILATHFLDEAEYFSDSVVIINDGKIIAKHNPQTLKILFTKSFELTIEINRSNMEILENIKILIEKYLKNFKHIQQTENEIKISVIYDPTINDCTGFLNELEILQNDNKIIKFSINSKNLESIFNNLNKGLEKLTNGDIKSNDKPILTGKTYEKKDFKNNLSKKTIIYNLLWKRYLHLQRNYKLILCILILPAFFEIIAMSFMQLRPGGEYDNEINLSRNLYPDTIEFFSLENSKNYTNQIIDNLKIPQCVQSNSNCQEFSDSEKIFYWILETNRVFEMDRYGGITINDSIVNVWYNNKGYHSMVSWLNDLNTNILRAELNNTDLKITTFNKPIKVGDHELSTSSILQQVSDAGISLILMIAFSLVAAGASVFLVNERISGEKLQQKLCGVDFQTYWGVAYFWDFLIFLISLVICVIIFKIFNISIYVDKSNLNGICLLVVLYGFASIPSIHVFEKLFNEPSIANMTIFCMNVIIALFTLTVIVLFDVLGESDASVNWRNFLNRAFLIFPQHALADGLIDICKNHITAQVFLRYDIDTYKSPVSSSLLLPQYIALVVMGLLFILINYIIESNNHILINKKIRNYLNKNDNVKPVELKTVSIQDNLYKNNDYIKTLSDKYTLNVDNLEKSYNKGQYAVYDVSFQVKAGECFGLLGKNGAGKSTIFKIITGQIHQDGGSYTYLNKNISYCPQTIALDPLLTVREIIKFYSKLRRINDVTNLITTVLKSFNLENYENILVKNLSGGNRRKLNVAVSCLGDSSIILMDEPTSDMDPVTRCLVYKAINNLLADGKSVLLTSHAISEIDQVCQRIGILKNGKLINCGSPNDLKYQFGGYYNVTIFYDNNDLSSLKQDIQIAFPQFQNIEIHPHSIKFLVKIQSKSINESGKSLHADNNDVNDNNEIKLSNLFANLNQFSSINKINFSINRCRLDFMIEKLLNLNNSEIDIVNNIESDIETGQCTYADNKGYINTET